MKSEYDVLIQESAKIKEKTNELGVNLLFINLRNKFN